MQIDDGFETITVNWSPNINGRPGTHFFVKYRIKDETSDPSDYDLDEDPSYVATDPELYEDFIIIRGLNPNKTYEFIVVSVDGEYMAESEVKEIPPIENR